MKNQLPIIPIKDSIVAQLLEIVILLCSLLVVAVTALNMTAEYLETKAKVMEELKSLAGSLNPGLSRALWEVNLPQIHSMITGIHQIPTIVGVHIQDQDGRVIDRIGRIPDEEGGTIFFDRLGKENTASPSNRLFGREFPLDYDRGDQVFPLGSVTIYSSPNVIFNRIRFGFLLLITGAVIQLIAFSVLFLWVFRRRLSRPLAELAQATGQLDLDNLEDIHIRFPSKRRNELKRLEDTFNAMIQKLRASRENLRDLNRSLQEHRDELEERVAERTRALHESEAELRALFSGLTEVVIMVNRDGTIQKIAPTSTELLYKPIEELAGRTLHDTFSGDLADDFLIKIQESLDAPQLVRIEYSLDINGREIWFDGRIVPMSDDVALFVAHDVTERKLQEALMHRTMMAAEAANQAKSEFLANMSHEIRTPMNAIIGLSYLAMQTPMSSRQRDYQHKIQSAADSLLRLIDDILDFSKIEAGKLEMEHRSFSLQNVMDNVAGMINVGSAQKGLDFSLSVTDTIPDMLVGDALRLEQVLSNLASNAVKFTHQGSVCVAVEPVGENERDATLRFIVSDTGIGMTAEQIDRLFQPFYQADASITRKYGGSGLGLAISKRLVEMIGGELDVISRPGEGSRFTFTACFGKSAEAIPVQSNACGGEDGTLFLGGARLLLVEDNEINLQVAGELLQRCGAHVETARNGREGLDAAVGTDFDLILMDLQMPVMDGFTASALIRSTPGRENVPIIAMTANARPTDREKCLSAGMNDHLAKPIKPDQLFATLIRWLRPEAENRLPGQHVLQLPFTPVDGVGDSSDIPGVDTRTGLAHVNGDRGLYTRVLVNTYQRHRDTAEQIRMSLQNGEINKAQALSHTLKGVAGTIGATELASRAADLEVALESSAANRIESLVTALAEESSRVMEALKVLSDNDADTSGKEAEPEPFDLGKVREELEHLGQLIEEGNSDALEVVVLIRCLLGTTLTNDDVRRLESQIQEYEFDEARETLHRVIARLERESSWKNHATTR